MSIHTLASIAQTSRSTHLFPTTRNVHASPFAEIQSGPTRTVMPTFASAEEERQYRKEHLVLCFRALHRQGLAEGVAGHCSTRDPVEPSTFWVNPQGRSFARMRVSDLIRVNEDGEIVEGDRPVDASATSIHAPIYKSRGRGYGHGGDGVEAIVHVHGPHSKAFSALGRQLDRINQDVCAFDDCTLLVPFGGAVFDDLEGRRIASFFKPDTRVALLQNHGALCLGRLSIDEAAWWQINYEMCCRAQLLADAAGGELVRVGDAECKSTKEEIGTSEMGWFCMNPYIEDELWESKGDHLLWYTCKRRKAHGRHVENSRRQPFLEHPRKLCLGIHHHGSLPRQPLASKKLDHLETALRLYPRECYVSIASFAHQSCP